MIAESLSRVMVWTCDTRPNAVLRTLTYACAWRSTCVVAKHKSLEYGDRPQQPHEIEAQMEVEQSSTCVGQDCFRMGWRRRMEQHKKKVSEFSGQKRFL